MMGVNAKSLIGRPERKLYLGPRAWQTSHASFRSVLNEHLRLVFLSKEPRVQQTVYTSTVYE